MLKLHGVSAYTADGTLLLENINFVSEKGESIVLVGRSGAGKTSLLRLLSGLLKVHVGQFRLNNADITQLGTHAIAQHIGTVFQEPDLQFFCATVEKEVMFSARLFTVAEQEAVERTHAILKRVGLSQFLQVHPRDLCFGDKRLLSVALALVGNPGILVLDEPQRGMDKARTERLHELLADEVSRGHTVIFSCHDMEFTLQRASRILGIADKTIQFDGQIDCLLSREGILFDFGIILPDLVRLGRTMKIGNNIVKAEEFVAQLTAQKEH